MIVPASEHTMKPYFKALIEDLNKIPIKFNKPDKKKKSRFEESFYASTDCARSEGMDVQNKACKVSFYGIF